MVFFSVVWATQLISQVLKLVRQLAVHCEEVVWAHLRCRASAFVSVMLRDHWKVHPR